MQQLLCRHYKMTKLIEHRGSIIAILPHQVNVLIIQNSACSGCHAKSACTASDSAEKIIEIPTSNTAYEVGQQVTIVGSNSMGWKAVGYAFGLPFLLLMIILIATNHYTKNEVYAGLLALSALIPYYLVLYLLHERMKSRFTFTIKA